MIINCPDTKTILDLDYYCHHCEATNCKLWFYRRTTKLLCAVCVTKIYQRNIDTIDDNGTFQIDPKDDRRTDVIGPWLPAIPKKNGADFHGRYDVPVNRYEWWKQLPSLRSDDFRIRIKEIKEFKSDLRMLVALEANTEMVGVLLRDLIEQYQITPAEIIETLGRIGNGDLRLLAKARKIQNLSDLYREWEEYWNKQEQLLDLEKKEAK